MRIWLIDLYDALPDEPWGYRSAIVMADVLCGAGHDVLWWTSNFAHATKKFRTPKAPEPWSQSRVTLRVIPVTRYKRHVSIARLLSVLIFSLRVYKRGLREKPKPDCVILVLPLPLGDLILSGLAKKLGARLVVIHRDLWPESFPSAVPALFRPLVSLLCKPLFAMRNSALERSNALIGTSPAYLSHALEQVEYSERRVTAIVWGDFGLDLGKLNSGVLSDSGVRRSNKQDSEVRAIYAGTLGHSQDIETLIEAAAILRRRCEQVQFVITGDGPLRPLILASIKDRDLSNLCYRGVLERAELYRLYGQCDIAICPSRPNALVSFPTKAFEYLAAGLPMVSSLKGELGELVKSSRCGLYYEAGSAVSLAAAIEELASDDKERRLMSKQARIAAQQFDRSALASELLRMVGSSQPAHSS